MITFDFETKSYSDLKRTGAWAYSEDPTTDVICCAYQIDDEPIQSWWPGKPLVVAPQKWIPGVAPIGCEKVMPFDLHMALIKDHLIEAHNVAFERSIWKNVMVPKYGWFEPADEQWRDTMAVAAYYALPLALDKLARVLGFGSKDPEGTRLISKYSKLHLKTAKTEIPDEDFEKFVSYCVKDVKLERQVSTFLGDLPDRELPVFLLDQRVNLRGLYLDRDGIEAATEIVRQRSQDLAEEFEELTGFRPTQWDKVMRWFEDNGLHLENMQAAYLEEILDDLPSGDIRRAITIRLAINRASTKKLDAMSRQRGVDNRARFQTRYHGAVTGRWTGSGFQPLNLNRGFDGVDPGQLVRDISYRNPAYLDTVYGDAMDAVARASRHWIMAAPGNKIISGDFISIEAVILACLAGEQWKINAFKDGVKIYEFMADKIHNLPDGTVSNATHPAFRRDGKTGELAFGYQGALGAWLKFDNSGRHSDERIIQICKAWREAHPNIVALWRGLRSSAIEAVKTGKLVTFRLIGFEVVDQWLTMILPNGKRLWYWQPEIEFHRPKACVPEEKEKCATGACGHTEVETITYMAQKTGQWQRVSTYGGKLTENACQAVSREILVPAMMRAEEAGYHVILSVYDEIVVEVPEDFGGVGEFVSLMAGPLPEWAGGWPIGVDAWTGQRYRK